jgi:hypothetical protein
MDSIKHMAYIQAMRILFIGIGRREFKAFTKKEVTYQLILSVS